MKEAVHGLPALVCISQNPKESGIAYTQRYVQAKYIPCSFQTSWQPHASGGFQVMVAPDMYGWHPPCKCDCNV